LSVDTPAPAIGLTEVAQVTGGGEGNGLAVMADGTARSWGKNVTGALGNGTTEERWVAGVVPGLANVVELAAGEYHVLALLADGRVMAWGGNGAGQLGLGSPSGPQDCGGDPCSTTPVAVPGITNAVAVAASEETSFALLADGTVLAWGYDAYGDVGDGAGVGTGCFCVPTPVTVPGVSRAIAIDGDQNSAIALIADGSVMTWGKNSEGQAGNGTQTLTGCECSAPGVVTGISTAIAVSVGDYADFALLANGTVMGWGDNSDGGLATGSFEGPEVCDGPADFGCSRTPIPVGGLTNVRGITGIGRSAAALLEDGTARSWGYNAYGELGNGDHGTEIATPGTVSNVSGASSLGAGEYMAFALIGPSQTLSVAFAGAGKGSVTGRELSCPPRCSGRYPQGQTALLTASPADFAGFSGACTGTAVCAAKMDSDQTVTATFGVPTGTKITKAKIVSKKKKATFAFSAPGAITGYQCLLIKPKAKKKKRKAKASKKAKKPKFGSCKGPKTYKGLKPGKYTFKVRALDILGADAKPAKRVFKIKPPKKKRR